MDVRFTGFLFEFLGNFSRNRSKGSHRIGVWKVTPPVRGCLCGLWERFCAGQPSFWLGKISFMMGKNTQKAMQHWRKAAMSPPMASPSVLYSQG